MSINVIVFDDSVQRRESLQLLLNTSEGFACKGLYENGSDAAAYVMATNPDVILMDIDMPVVTGIEAVKEIRKEFSDVAILMQTVFDEDEKVFDSIMAGANGYLLKQTRSAELLQAIKDAHEGNSPMTPSIAKKVLAHFRNLSAKPQPDNYGLTQREKEILQQLVEGKSYKMVADFLKISTYTVNDHIKNIYRKLQVHNAAEAVKKALKERIV